jgi:hypothetical protein
MLRVRLFLLTALSCWIAICFAQCSTDRRKPGETQATSAALNAEDDSKTTFDAYKKPGSPESKIRLAHDFLKRNPNNRFTIEAVEYVAQDYFLEQKKDPDGAVKFALQYLANLNDENLKRRADLTLIALYGKTGDKTRLHELAGQVDARRGLTLDDCAALAEAALKAKDGEFAVKLGELLMAKNTPHAVRAKAGQEMLSDEKVAQSIARNRARALILMGRGALEMNDAKTALDYFGEAAKTAQRQYAGPLLWPYRDLNLYWAKALLKTGNAQGAMGKIGVETAILSDKTALEVLQEALSATGSKENPRQYVDRTRPGIAKTMPAFSAYNYDQKKVNWNELKGQVSLLTFWSPT